MIECNSRLLQTKYLKFINTKLFSNSKIKKIYFMKNKHKIKINWNNSWVCFIPVRNKIFHLQKSSTSRNILIKTI